MVSKLAAAEIASVFREILPSGSVIDDVDICRIAASDIAFEAGDLPACVLEPENEAQLVALVRAACAEGIALYPRGGGWSYTEAHTPQSPRAAMVNTSRLGGISLKGSETVEVGAGVTWSSLDDELKLHGLRVPSFGPLSGISAQIGSTIANDGAFFGGAAYGAIGERSVASVTLIDGRGERRQFKPSDCYDPVIAPQPLAGDCGAFGIKTQISLNLMQRPKTTLFSSFAFRDGDPMVRAMAGLLDLPGLGEVYAFNEGVHQNLIAGGFSVLEAAVVDGKCTSDWTGQIPGLKTDRAATASLADIPWALHISIEGDPGKTEEVRAEVAGRMASFGGEAIPDVLPRVTRAKPFRPIKALVTPMGELWLSSHGLVEASDGASLLRSLQAILSQGKDEQSACGLRSGFLVSLIGRRITVEPQLYWRDALSPYLRAKATAEQVARFGDAPENLQGRKLAFQLRQQLISAMDAAGAGHFQIGRTYAAHPNVPQAATEYWRSLKKKFDPGVIMNPGVLGL